MPERITIADKDKKLLWGRSGNMCAFPGCEQQLTKRVGSTGVVVGEMAHICGQREGSARFDSSLSPEFVNSYPNLILLCPTHHTLVDQDDYTYTVDKLQKMKENHERRVSEKNITTIEFEGHVSVKSKDGDSVTGAKITKPTRIKSGSSFTVETDNVKNVTGLYIGGE